ncbi:hypothetical protein FRC00_003843 [Tulasnella sp. 408]|nr:hypothetical protein FRC00_003843 [Tulasnella sp. 408]
MVSEVLANVPEVVFRPDAFTYDEAFSTFTITKTDPTPKPARPRIPSTFRRVAADAGGKDLSSSPSTTFLTSATASTMGSNTLNEMDAEEEIVQSVQQTKPKNDANAKLYDQLVKKPVWLILEYLPTFQYYPLENKTWGRRFRWNASRPREIYDSNPHIHESVKLRENYEGKWSTKFIPKKGQQVEITYVKSEAGRPIGST